MIRIELGPESSPGLWEYSVPSLGLCGKSRQPLLDACRQIKRTSGDTAELAGLFRKGRDGPDMDCRVSWGAAMTFSEPDNGVPHFVKYRAFELNRGTA